MDKNVLMTVYDNNINSMQKKKQKKKKNLK